MPNCDLPRLTMDPAAPDTPNDGFERLVDLVAKPIMTKHPGLSLYNTTMDENSLAAIVASTLDDPADMTRQKVMHAVMDNTFDDYPATIERPDLDLFYVHAAAQRAGWPAPAARRKPRVMYTAQDAIDGAQHLLDTGNPDQLIAGIGYAFSPKTLGVIVENTQVFNTLKTDLKAYALLHTTSTKVQNMFDQFDRLTMDKDTLTQALLLRKEHSDTFDANSFASIMLAFLHEACNMPNGPIIAPFSLFDLVSTRSIVFINATAHANETIKKVDAEWLIINKSTNHPLNIVNFNAITKLSQAITSQQRAASMASANSNTNKKPAERRVSMKFRAKRPKTVNIIGQVEKIMLTMGRVNRSQNVSWTSQRSPLKANRRQPNNYNAFGTLRKQIYIPDLHVYVDTSGSISIEDQKNQIIMLIQLAKKLDIDFYFSTFSHVLSPEVLVPTKGRTPAQVWNNIMSIPKVGGGTNFRQISEYINLSDERRARMNLVITDFGWTHHGASFKHSKNLWYAPCSGNDWSQITMYARGFINSMGPIEPTGRTAQRCLGLF